MVLIINTCNLLQGGAMQRALSFLNHIKHSQNNEYHIFLTEILKREIVIEDFSASFKFYEFTSSPAPLYKRFRIIKKFSALESEISPDLVFSFVGPSYWRPKSPHLVGFALGHLVYTDSRYVRNYPLKTKLEMLYKRYWIKKETDYYVVQMFDVRERLCSVMGIPREKSYIVTNGAGYHYQSAIPKARNMSEIKRLLMLSTYRPNKNFEIIRDVIPYLRDDSLQYEFHVTLKEDDYQRLFSGLEAYVINHGYVPAESAPELYNFCDAMFLPTHLECFSASYPEAMRMEKPILTSNLPFATSVCGDAAIYFDNTNAIDIAAKIRQLFNNKNLYASLIAEGKEQLKTFDCSKVQAEKYLKICEHIIDQQNREENT